MNSRIWPVVTAFIVLCVPAFGDVSEARAAMGQYRAEIQAAGEAAAKNDAKGAASREANARKHLKKACQEFAAAGAAKSNDLDVLRDYASALMRNDDYDLAAEALQRAVEVKPDDPALWISLGSAMSESGSSKANDAAAAFHKAIELTPSADVTASAYLGLGDLYRRHALHALARESFSKALDAKPDFRAAQLSLAAARVREGEVLQASTELDALGAMSNEEGALLVAHLSESLRAFEEARLTFPDTHEHHMAYAKLLLRAGRNTQALSAVERAAVLNADDYVTWNLVGGLSRQMGDAKRAREAYAKSLEINPDQPRTQEALKTLSPES